MFPKISVIVPVYNALDDVKLCLDSLRDNFDFSLGQVIIINDCSNSETNNFLKEFSQNNQDFTLMNNQENLGFVKTCNKGMKLAKGEIVVLLNSDTMIPKNFSQRIIQCFDMNPEVGIASPIGSYTASYFITLPHGVSLEQMNELLEKRHICSYPIIPKAEGFCFCIRRDVIEHIGYLDEVFGKGYGEECDYSCRARQYGYEIVLIDDLYVYHKRQASFGSKNREKLFSEHNSILKSRWDNLLHDFEKRTHWKNPISKIRYDLFTKKFGPFNWYFGNDETYFGIFKLKIFRIKRKIKEKRLITRWIIGGICIFQSSKKKEN